MSDILIFLGIVAGAIAIGFFIFKSLKIYDSFSLPGNYYETYDDFKSIENDFDSMVDHFYWDEKEMNSFQEHLDKGQIKKIENIDDFLGFKKKPPMSDKDLNKIVMKNLKETSPEKPKLQHPKVFSPKEIFPEIPFDFNKPKDLDI